MTTSPPQARCWAQVNLAALGANLRKIRAALPRPMTVVSVVKADAYGHGLIQAAAALVQGGADMLAVANVAEAAALREGGARLPILLLGPVLPGEDSLLAAHDLAAPVSDPDEVERFSAAGQAAGRTISVHLKIDTGMGRMGVWHEEAAELHRRVASAPNLRLAGVMTHFADPDRDAEFTAEQRRRFESALRSCPGILRAGTLVHADNSAGLESMTGAPPFNTIRIGLLQYGIPPHPASPLIRLGVEPALSLRTRVGLVKRLPRGASVSYGRTRTLERDSAVALLCAGYADGIPRAASNRAEVLIHGRRCPVLGRVTMDLIMADVTDLPGVLPGEEAVFFGRQAGGEISLAEYSGWCGTIPWESLCAISKRVPRVYAAAP